MRKDLIDEAVGRELDELDRLRAEVELLEQENAELRSRPAGPIPGRVQELYRYMAAEYQGGATVVRIEEVRDILSGRATAKVAA